MRARPAHARVPLPVDCMYGTVVAHLALGDRLCAAHAPFFWLCSRLFCVSTMIMAVLSADRNAYRAACTRPAAPPRATQLRIHVLPLCDESCAVSSSRSFAGRCVLFGVDEGVCKRVFGACTVSLHSDARRAVYSCPDAPPLVTCLRIHVTPLWFQFCADSPVHSPAPRSLLHGALWMTWLHLNHFHCPSEYFGRSRPPAARRPRAGDPGRDPDLPLAS